jgi:hypothetical protein
MGCLGKYNFNFGTNISVTCTFLPSKEYLPWYISLDDCGMSKPLCTGKGPEAFPVHSLLHTVLLPDPDLPNTTTRNSRSPMFLELLE